MIQINDTVIYDETKPFQEQTQECQQWLMDNALLKINDQYKVTDFDPYERPRSYIFKADGHTIVVYPQYIFEDAHNWAISGNNIEIQ
jgi:hypothetical protein